MALPEKSSEGLPVACWCIIVVWSITVFLGFYFCLPTTPQPEISNSQVSYNSRGLLDYIELYLEALNNTERKILVLRKISSLPNTSGPTSSAEHLLNPTFCNESRTWNEPRATFVCSRISASMKNIFFMETSCSSLSNKSKSVGLTLTSKQACSIYSAALHNPSRKIILLFTCPLDSEFYDKTSDTVKRLFDLPNFFFGLINLQHLYTRTPFSGLYDKIQTSSMFPVAHNSDITRLYVIYLCGGTYMDLDTISLRSMDNLGSNFIGSGGNNSVLNGILNFKPHHRFIKECLTAALSVYKPSRWNSIGPRLTTSVLRKSCNVSRERNIDELSYVNSCDLTVLPVKTFYAVDSLVWYQFFDANYWHYIERLLNESYVAHYWNKMGTRLLLVVGSDQPVIKLARKHCLPILELSGQIFS